MAEAQQLPDDGSRRGLGTLGLGLEEQLDRKLEILEFFGMSGWGNGKNLGRHDVLFPRL